MCTSSKSYSKKLTHPKWQKMRLEILNRDGFICQRCLNNNEMLVVHHRYYLKNRDPWDYPTSALITYCEACHKFEHDNYPIAENNLLAACRQAGLNYIVVQQLSQAIINMFKMGSLLELEQLILSFNPDSLPHPDHTEPHLQPIEGLLI